MSIISNLRRTLEQRKGERSQIQKDLDITGSNLNRANRRYDQSSRALEIVKLVGLETQKMLEYHLAEQVSLALSAIFDDPYSLVVNFQDKRGQTEAEILFKRRQLLVKPVGSVGWGAIDVGAFALRLAHLTMRQDKKTRSTLFLDEPFARLKGRAANMRALQLINEISNRLKIQIIMISDERIPREDIIENADRAFLTKQIKGKSQIKQL